MPQAMPDEASSSAAGDDRDERLAALLAEITDQLRAGDEPNDRRDWPNFTRIWPANCASCGPPCWWPSNWPDRPPTASAR